MYTHHRGERVFVNTLIGFLLFRIKRWIFQFKNLIMEKNLERTGAKNKRTILQREY